MSYLFSSRSIVAGSECVSGTTVVDSDARYSNKRRRTHGSVQGPACAVLVMIALSVQQPVAAAGRNVYEFGKRSQLQWIVDEDRDAQPDARVNFGDIDDTPVPADYDGDGNTDVAVLRSSSGGWSWIVDTDDNGFADIRIGFGQADDKPFAGDFNADGIADFAVIRETGGQLEWIIDTNRDGSADKRQVFGKASDTASPADYDGDGRTDFAVLRDAGGKLEWIVDTQGNGIASLRRLFGNSTDTAHPADYDGDGRADFAVTRIVDDQLEWIIDTDRDGTADIRRAFGSASDTARSADFDGDGRADLAVLRTANGRLEWIIDHNHDGSPDKRLLYGRSGDLPVPADHDGDGATDLVVVRQVSYVNGAGWSAIEDAVDSIVMNHLKENRVPGATVAISKEGRLVLSKAYGVRDIVENTPMLPHYATRIGSTTKVITALGVLKLVEQKPAVTKDSKLYGPGGLLPSPVFTDAIAENLATQLASGDAAPNDPGWFDSLRLSHLLSHSAGFRGLSAEKVAEILGIDEAKLTYRQIHAEFLRRQKLRFEPGSGTKYANHHLGTVGHVIETVSGKDYVDFINANVLSPIGLDGRIRPEDGIIDTGDSLAHTYSRVDFGLENDIPVPADYGGNGSIGFAVVRKLGGDLVWSIDSDRDGTVNLRQRFGTASDVPLSGDYNGDGSSDLTVLRDAAGKLNWLVDTDHNGATDLRVQFGLSGDIAKPADYNADGRTDFAVLRRRTEDGQWQWLVDTDHDGVTDLEAVFGKTSDLAVPADYNGDGAADFGLLRNVDNELEWIVDINHDGEVDFRSIFGRTGDTPHPADYDGDGATDFAVTRVENGELQWKIDTDRNGIRDIQKKFGSSSSIPLAADYSGNGRADIAILRSRNGKLQWATDVDAEIYNAEPDPLEYPAGGLTASAKDLVSLMCATDGLPNRPDILSAATLRLMETPPFPDSFTNRTLGWDRASSGKLAHSGLTKGGASYMAKYPSGAEVSGVDVGDINVAVALNIDNSSGLIRLLERVAQEAGRADIPTDFDLFAP